MDNRKAQGEEKLKKEEEIKDPRAIKGPSQRKRTIWVHWDRGDPIASYLYIKATETGEMAQFLWAYSTYRTTLLKMQIVSHRYKRVQLRMQLSEPEAEQACRISENPHPHRTPN